MGATLVSSFLIPISQQLPQRPVLQSLLPLEPIEEPPTWSWANHPRRGFSYKSKDGLSVEVCLENPKLIDTARCNLPLDVCLANPQYISSVGCSGNTYPVDICLQYPATLTMPPCAYPFPVDTCAKNTFLLDTSKYANQCNFEFPLKVCMANTQLFSRTQCRSHVSGSVCASNPEITNEDFCLEKLKRYQPTLFECSDNKVNLCKLKLCDKHQFIVKC